MENTDRAKTVQSQNQPDKTVSKRATFLLDF